MTMRFPSLKFASTLQNCTETEILDGLEKIVRGEVVADGCALTKGKDVGEVVGAALQKMDKSNTVLVDLHESHANMLPVYAGAKQQDTATNAKVSDIDAADKSPAKADSVPPLCPVVVLGCVQDHLESIETIKKVARTNSVPVQQV